MRSYLRSWTSLVIVCLSVPLGAVACGRHSGIERGDANDSTMRNSVPRPGVSSPQARETDPSRDDSFAPPPADASNEYDSESAAQPAETGAVVRARPNAPAAASMPQSAGAATSRDDAYAAKSRKTEPFRPREERPGLGTSWGETRKSWVSTVGFERDSQYAPTATQSIYYNDANGVLAQTGQRSMSALGRNQTEFGNGFVSVEVVDPEGYPLPGMVSHGRSYIVGRDGDRYSLRIRNNESYRVEVVASVDGLDVIDGTKAHFQKRGYVVDPYSTVLIEGFRKSTSSVASFRFGSVSDSYAARTGSDRHVGVIGIALFAERGCCVETYSQQELIRRESADPFPGQFARPPRQPDVRRQQWAE